MSEKGLLNNLIRKEKIDLVKKIKKDMEDKIYSKYPGEPLGEGWESFWEKYLGDEK